MADVADVQGISEHIPLPLRQVVRRPPGTNLDHHAARARRGDRAGGAPREGRRH